MMSLPWSAQPFSLKDVSSSTPYIRRRKPLLTRMYTLGPGCCPYLAVWDSVDGEEETRRLLRDLQDRVKLAGSLGLGTPLSSGEHFCSRFYLQ